MIEEYQIKAQEAIEQLEQMTTELDGVAVQMIEENPEEERTFRMHQAIVGIGNASQLARQAGGILKGIEWPTAERPR